MTGMWRSRPEAPDPDLAMDSFPKSLPISAPDVIDAKAEAELTRLLYRIAGFGLFSSFALAIILVAGTWTYVSPAPRLIPARPILRAFPLPPPRPQRKSAHLPLGERQSVASVK